MNAVQKALIDETLRRIIDISIPMIKQCLESLSEEEVWYNHNSNSNCVGVLVLHLCGNVRQWILSGVCGLPDQRERDLEFNPQSQPSINTLIHQLDLLAADLNQHLPGIKEGSLLEIRRVQCYDESVLSMLVHATEHFSYHTGQIVYFTKYMKDIDTAFYAGQDLTANN